MSSFKTNIEAPVSLGGLFNDDSDDETDNNFEMNYEVQRMTINNIPIDIRQYSWHMANANKVWPGNKLCLISIFCLIM
jgi:hypothetical protein